MFGQFFDARHNITGAGQKILSRWQELHASARTVDQCDAQFRFQSLNGGAQCRLGDADGIRSARKGACLYEREKIVKLADADIEHKMKDLSL
jgi:hypothetical protein